MLVLPHTCIDRMRNGVTLAAKAIVLEVIFNHKTNI